MGMERPRWKNSAPRPFVAKCQVSGYLGDAWGSGEFCVHVLMHVHLMVACRRGGRGRSYVQAISCSWLEDQRSVNQPRSLLTR